MKPNKRFSSALLPEVAEVLAGQGCFVCTYLAELPGEFFDASRKTWSPERVSPLFNRSEIESRPGSGSEKYRVQRLAGRVAAKEAVRRYLQEHYDIKVLPADIIIINNASGKPEVSGPWADTLSAALKLSLAHKQRAAVALVGESPTVTGIGVDLEPVQALSDYFLEGAFTEEERGLVAGLGSTAEEWLVKIWCAKEAVGKALGTGTVSAPRDIVAVALDIDNEGIRMELAGGRRQQFPQFSGKKLDVAIFRKGKMVIAATAL